MTSSFGLTAAGAAEVLSEANIERVHRRSGRIHRRLSLASPFAEATKAALFSPRFEIARLGRGERREQAAVGFQVDERRPVEAVEAPDQERRPPPLDQRRPAPCRSGSGERASAAKMCRASHHHWPDFGARDHAATRAANREPRSARTPRSRPAPRPRARRLRCGRSGRRLAPGADNRGARSTACG